MNLTKLDFISSDFFNLSIKDLHQLYPTPTIIYLKGVNDNPLFISTLLHGNEHSGVMALQEWLRPYCLEGKQLDRSLILFIANPMAARENLRSLEGQIDFNRVWSGGNCPFSYIAKEVIQFASSFSLFASVDIHNNTGKNPFYSCINKIDPKFITLAQHFSETLVYFTRPSEVQSMAFSKLAPSITIEAGTSGETKGVEILVQKLEALISLDNLADYANLSELAIHHTVGRMLFTKNTTMDFDNNINSSKDLSLLSHIDSINFSCLKEDVHLGYINNTQCFWVEDDSGDDITDQYFKIEDNKLLVKKNFVPAMVTKNIKNIHEDCFGYIMEYYPL